MNKEELKLKLDQIRRKKEEVSLLLAIVRSMRRYVQVLKKK